MKNIYLNKDQIGMGNSISLPDFFKSQQYINPKLVSSSSQSEVGNIWNRELSFFIDATHPFDTETENALWLNKLLPNGKSMISRVKLEEKFIILEINDYSHQAMSSFYSDFIPLVFLNGTKIKQKYISIIKEFTNKKAYILIDREYKDSIEQNDDIKIIVSFKDSDRTQSTNNLKERSIVIDEKINSKTFSKQFKQEDSKLLFTFQNKNINDYYIKINNKRINFASVKSFEITDGENKIQKQGKYFTLVSKNRNLISTNKTVDNRPDDVTATITIEFYNDVSAESLTLYSKSVLADISVKSKNAYPYDLLYNTDVWYFDNNGKKSTKDNYYELIPQYNSKRVIDFTVDGTCLIKDALYSQTRPEIYRWNLKNPEMIYFDNEGKYLGPCDYNTTIYANYEVIIYDNLEEIGDVHGDQTNVTFTDLKVYNDASDPFDFIYTKSISKLANEFTNTPLLSFYAFVNPNSSIELFEKTKFYIFMKYYPVYYEEYKIDKYTIYYKLPQHILDNLDIQLYNSIENTVFIERDENFREDMFIIDPTELSHNDINLKQNYLCIEETNSNGDKNIIKTKTLYNENYTLTFDESTGSYKYNNEEILGLNDNPVISKRNKIYTISLNDSPVYDTTLSVSNNVTNTEFRGAAHNNKLVKGLIEKVFGENMQTKIIEYIDSENNLNTIPNNIANNSLTLGTKYLGTFKAEFYESIIISEHSKI